ncbi:hypothetical protein [Streptomyces sp. NPDC058476]|uniref:hypothetical protein n=1 Tax=Streptomyces sp. NPDC058476 TaxID=3346519 RepID=UPI0036646566
MDVDVSGTVLGDVEEVPGGFPEHLRAACHEQGLGVETLVKQIPVLPVVPCLVVNHGFASVSSRVGQRHRLRTRRAEPPAHFLPA